MDLKALIQTVSQIAEEKGIDEAKVLEAIESALATAYKREHDKRSLNVRTKLDPETGSVSFAQIKEVVDETMVRIPTDTEDEAEIETETDETEEKLPRYNPDRHILIEEAKKEKKDAVLGDEIEYPLEEDIDFGRIAAQAAKQMVLQKLREAERESIVTEYKDKEGEIVSGVIQRFERGNVFVDLGRTTGIMFSNESIPGEHYRPGERLRFFVLGVQAESRTPGIILSRANPGFISKLFELEIPEIADGVVEIKEIAREAGSRAKVAVYSNTEGIDPVGSCVGQRGTRIMAITNELGQEKLDVIEWAEDPEHFISQALNPAKVRSVELIGNREAKIFVADDQLSLAIGKGGQNVRLAAKLTGWKIDVRSQARPEEELEGGVGEIASKEDSGSDAEITEDAHVKSASEEDAPVYHKSHDEDIEDEVVGEDKEEEEEDSKEDEGEKDNEDKKEDKGVDEEK